MPESNHPLIEKALEEGCSRFSVKVILPDPENPERVLMLKRKANEKRAGQWDLPGGGADKTNPQDPTCKTYECLLQAAQREVHEEIGDDVDLGDMTYLDMFTDYTSSAGAKVRMFFFSSQWMGTPAFPPHAEHDQMAWVDDSSDVWQHVKPAFQKAILKHVDKLAQAA